VKRVALIACLAVHCCKLGGHEFLPCLISLIILAAQYALTRLAHSAPVAAAAAAAAGCLLALLQAWIAVIADKLEVSLEGYTVSGTGFKASSSSSSSSSSSKTKSKASKA
jgi:hypothetical protein